MNATAPKGQTQKRNKRKATMEWDGRAALEGLCREQSDGRQTYCASTGACQGVHQQCRDPPWEGTGARDECLGLALGRCPENGVWGEACRRGVEWSSAARRPISSMNKKVLELALDFPDDFLRGFASGRRCG